MTEIPQPLLPERGFLQRMRSWRDVVPALAITDCLRPASSLFCLLLVGLALILARGAGQLFAPEITKNEVMSAEPIEGFTLISEIDLYPGGGLAKVFGPLAGRPSDWVGTSVPGGSVSGGVESAGIGTKLAHQAVLLLIWMIPAGFVIRQSGLSMGGRSLRGTTETLKLVVSRWRGFLATALIPTLAFGLIVAYFALAAIVAEIPAVGGWLSGGMHLLGLPLILAAGLIGLAAVVAIPLSWGAVSLERDGDAFDAISRGFEYTLRRPLHWVVYGTVGWLVLTIFRLLGTGVMVIAAWVLLWTQSSFGENSVVHQNFGLKLLYEAICALPEIIEITVFFSLVAWLYLLLRQSTNNQEIEDLWEPPLKQASVLPELKIGKA